MLSKDLHMCILKNKIKLLNLCVFHNYHTLFFTFSETYIYFIKSLIIYLLKTYQLLAHPCTPSCACTAHCSVHTPCHTRCFASLKQSSLPQTSRCLLSLNGVTGVACFLLAFQPQYHNGHRAWRCQWHCVQDANITRPGGGWVRMTVCLEELLDTSIVNIHWASDGILCHVTPCQWWWLDAFGFQWWSFGAFGASLSSD